MNTSHILEQSRKALKLIASSIYEPIAPLECTCFSSAEPIPYAQRESGHSRGLRPGDTWAESAFGCAWLHFTGTVPVRAAGFGVAALIDIGGELLITDGEGNPHLGFGAPSAEGMSSSAGQYALSLVSSAHGDEAVSFWADCSRNDPFGQRPHSGTVKLMQLATLQPNMYELYFDLLLLTELAEQLPERSARHAGIVLAIDRALQALTSMTDERASHARFILLPELARRAADVGLTISALGVPQPDSSWLQPVRENRRDTLRRFSAALNNLDNYDYYVFGADQPQRYQWIKDASPRLYERIREYVHSGRWETLGGMWVEADTCMASSESLVRQILYGKRFFTHEFAKDVTTMSLLNSFGYAAQLPQLMKLSGMEYFLGANPTIQGEQEFPYSTFWWQGLDGSRVLTHMPPRSKQCCAASPASIVDVEHSYREAGLSENALLPVGMAHEPDTAQLELLKRERSISGLAPVELERVCDFFAKLERARQALPVWVGEIFAANRDGTYTSQLNMKRANRKLEYQLQLSELISAARLLSGASVSQDKLESLWQRALANQHYALLSGTSAALASDEARTEYGAILRELAALTAHIADGTLGLDMVVNTHAWTIETWVMRDDTLCSLRLPPLSATSVYQASPKPLPQLEASAFDLENDLLKLTFDERGRLTEILDKTRDWNVLNGMGNQLNIYHDDGDAWRIGAAAHGHKLGAFGIVETACRLEGPYAIRESTYRYGKSLLRQQIRICAGSARVEFITKIEWCENNKLVRAEFPLDINAGRFLCDVQFGYVERPTHRNTPYAAGMAEVYAHKWADLSQSNRGVAIMLDGGYGHSCLDNLLSVSLVRAPSYPDPQSDRVVNELRYAIYPHSGDLATSDVVRQSYEFQYPPVTMPCAAFGPLAWTDCASVVIESVKCAEDTRDIVFRLYECHGGTQHAHLRLGFAAQSACEADLMEHAIRQLECVADEIALEFRPFEIKTVIVSKRAPSPHADMANV